MGDYVSRLEAFVQQKKEENTEYRPMLETDDFTLEGKTQFSVLDVWRYAYSRMDTGTIAEFLVAHALGVEKAENVNYWSAYDMTYRNKRIEVKASSYVHPWNKTRVSNVRTFSIEPSKNAYWAEKMPFPTDEVPKYSRQSEVYVFCLNADKNIEAHDPLNLDTWEFYIVPTFKIDEYARKMGNIHQKKISLNVVKKLSGGAAAYDSLRKMVDQAIQQSDLYYSQY